MRPTYRSLREFEALRMLIATGTATSAARRLGISQSAVSRAVAQLEARVGQVLFERRQGRLLPTAEALALNESLLPLFDSLARLDSGQWSPSTQEPLRLVAPPTIAHQFLSSRIASFLKVHPEQRIAFEIATSDAVLAGVADQRYDVGITDLNADHAGVRFEPFIRSDAVCIFPKNNRLADLSSISVVDMAAYPFVALTRRHRVRSLIDSMFAEAHVEPKVMVETATSVALVALVQRGLGCAILNPFPVVNDFKDTVGVRLLKPGFRYQTCFITSVAKPPHAVGRMFITHVRMNLGRYAYSEAMS
jgi:DNA-binding transcriptional LysR family regulator